MVGEWRVKTLDQLGRVVTGKTPPSTILDAFGGHTPFVTPSDMNGARIISNTTRHLSASGQAAVKSATIPKGAVMVSCIGSDMGKAAIAGSDCATNQQINSIIIETDDSPLFVYYNLSTRKSEIRGSASGSAQPILNKSAFGRLEIELPSPAEQRAIAHILGTLDDKIELNRRRNQTLEAMARALFKDWFVDFGPVRAKMEGREPYLPADIWQLFPDRLDDEGKPEGWRIVALSDLIEAERGLSYKGAGLADRESGIAMHNLNSVLEGGGYKHSGIKYYSGEYKERHVAKAGDIVVANTEQGHKHLLIGYPAIIPNSFKSGIFSHHLYRLRLRPDTQATKHWLYYTLMAPEVRDQIIGHANGSTVNMLKQTGLQSPSTVLPPLELCQRFENFADASHARKELSVGENETLSQQRDALLPKLISGELRIADVERFLKERAL